MQIKYKNIKGITIPIKYIMQIKISKKKKLDLIKSF